MFVRMPSFSCLVLVFIIPLILCFIPTSTCSFGLTSWLERYATREIRELNNLISPVDIFSLSMYSIKLSEEGWNIVGDGEKIWPRGIIKIIHKNVLQYQLLKEVWILFITCMSMDNYYFIANNINERTVVRIQGKRTN